VKPLSVDLGSGDLNAAGLRLLGKREGMAGVQTKLSLGRESATSRRLTVGWNGRFILKPASVEYRHLCENEAFCMELAERLKQPVAPHGLVRLQDGGLAYLSRRFDRPSDTERRHQEDFCQLAERPAADKYKGSLEAAGKLLRFSGQRGLDAVRFLELNLFCWLSGNADMHLKNFSLLLDTAGWALSPAYDLVSTALVLPDDQEETALTVNGKKANLKRADWAALASSLKVPDKVLASLWKRLADGTEVMETTIAAAPLDHDEREAFTARWRERLARD
jgi:serine/threonine-protein kinase HipA